MVPPPRNFAADAHECIMVRVARPAEYKVVARDLAPAAQFPSRRRLAEPMAAPRSRGCGKRRASLRRYGGALSPSFSTTNPSASPQGAKTPKRSAHPSRLDENAFFLLTKETPYKGWGEGAGNYDDPHPAP